MFDSAGLANSIRTFNEKPSQCFQKGPNAGECLSDGHLTTQRLIHS